MIKLAHPDIPQAAIDAATEVLRSGSLVQGGRVREFEEALAAFLEVDEAVLVSSGTAALHLALLALEIGHGDEVIVPAFTYPATANVVERVGATPILVDISLADFCLRPELVPERLSARTAALLPVHEFGQPAPADAIARIAREHGLPVVEDAACALGSEVAGRKAGTLGALGCFSLHPRKTITTGEGGLVVTGDRGLADRVRSLRNHGMVIEDGRADFGHAGLNYRMTEFQAALGPAQLGALPSQIRRRREIARLYDRLLAGVDWITTPRSFEDRPTIYQTYHLLLAPAVDRDRLILRLRDEGVEANLGAYALNCLRYYRQKYALAPEDHPNATAAYRRGLALPIGTHMTDADVEYVADRLRRLGP